jgi:hypothetical protein
MFIEGCVTKGYLQALRAARYDIQLAIESGEEASRLIQDNCDLPNPADHDYETHPWVRIYIDCNMEEYLTPFEVVDNADKENKLPLLIGNSDQSIIQEVEKALSRE